MTDDRSLERAARSWIEVGPTRAPDHAVEAALARIHTTPQERDWFPRRFPAMFTPARVAVAAVLGVLLIGGAVFTLGRQPAVGVPVPSATRSPAVSPSASSSPAAIVPARMADRLLGDWQAEVVDALPGISQAGATLQLSLDWQLGETAWVQVPNGEIVLSSTSVAAAADEIRLVSTARLGGCTPGDEGRYRWERPGDGMFLTLTVIEEACDSRASALGRTWVHSLSAVNDGGAGVIPFGQAWIGAVLPADRWGMSGATDGPVLGSQFVDGVQSVEFTIIRNPMGFDAPCSAERTGVPIEPTAAALVAYTDGLPGATVTTADGTVDGRPAVHLTIEVDAAIDCQVGELMAFHPPIATEDGEYTLALGETRSAWILERDGAVYLMWFAGEGVTAAEEQAVIDSLQFLDRLPTP